MSILFDSARLVNSSRPFALGLSARRDCRQPYTAADLQWNAENSPANATGYDVIAPTNADLTAMAWAEALGSELDRWRASSRRRPGSTLDCPSDRPRGPDRLRGPPSSTANPSEIRPMTTETKPRPPASPPRPAPPTSAD